ncbi:MAG: hypothetical protein AAF497_27670 [Planctomycetota bacterium]
MNLIFRISSVALLVGVTTLVSAEPGPSQVSTLGVTSPVASLTNVGLQTDSDANDLEDSESTQTAEDAMVLLAVSALSFLAIRKSNA